MPDDVDTADPDTSDTTGDTTSPFPPEGPCDPLVPSHCLLPFPSSLYLENDPTRETGFTLEFGAALRRNTDGRPVDPFTTHRFLSALDRSGSTGKGSGWQARPLVLRKDGKLLAATPLYVKSHSQGEYIFDHGWADALERAGGRYYPKLQIAVPFTPATGRRFQGADDHRDSLSLS